MSPAARTECDRLAPSYDRRYQINPLAGVERALRSLAAVLEPGRCLEVGCGTGRWLPVLGGAGASSVGVDPSLGMLARAASGLPDAELICADGAHLPLAAASFDLVAAINSVHHLADPRGLVQGCGRLIRPGGALTVVTLDRSRDLDWFVYDYFAGTREADLERFPALEAMIEWMLAAGFERIESAPVERIERCLRGRAVLDDYFLEKTSSSTLARLDDAAFDEGLARIRGALRRAERAGETLEFSTRLDLVMVTAWQARD